MASSVKPLHPVVKIYNLTFLIGVKLQFVAVAMLSKTVCHSEELFFVKGVIFRNEVFSYYLFFPQILALQVLHLIVEIVLFISLI